MPELFLAEYNFGQGTFHHGEVKELMKTNKEIIERLYKAKEENITGNAWIPFAIGTWEETSWAIDNMKKFFREYEM